MRSDVMGRVKLVCGLVLALILLVLGMVLITKNTDDPTAPAGRSAATSPVPADADRADGAASQGRFAVVEPAPVSRAG